MFDRQAIADDVSRWTGLGVTLPKDLAAAIATFEALRYTEVGYQPVFDVDSVTATNAETKIREFTDQLVLAEAPAGQLSALERAKKHAVDTAARRVNGLARQAVTEVIAQLAPEFEEHAAAYNEAVSKLPRELTPESLVAAGPDAVATYGQAQQEASYLNRISSWIASTGYLAGFVPKDMEVVLRTLRPTSKKDLLELDAAHARPVIPTLQAIDPVLFVAAKRGVEFGINTLAEAAEIRARLELAAVSSLL